MRWAAALVVLLMPLAAALTEPAQSDAGVPGDAPAGHTEARPLPGEGRYAGLLDGVNDFVDAYALEVDDDRPLRVALRGETFLSVAVHDPGGALIGSAFTAPGARAAHVVGDPAPGRWTLIVQVDLQAGGEYELILERGPSEAPGRPVVVATFDTGVNPWHPCWRRGGYEHPRDAIAGYPADSAPISLSFRSTHDESVAASQGALQGLQPRQLYHVPQTRLSTFAVGDPSTRFVDDEPHGAFASTQIACREFGFASRAHLVILDRYEWTPDYLPLAQWVAEQAWIDIVHVNAQDVPLLDSPALRPFQGPQIDTVTIGEGTRAMVASGKLVVIAAGNGVGGAGTSYPAELSRYAVPGVLIAGAVDNSGYTEWSNYDPHVVMDGVATDAGDSDSGGNVRFSGTSASSPRVAGYAAELLGRLREAGLQPSAAELHRLIRASADPRLHPSYFDGDSGSYAIPELPAGDRYPFVGYGEVSEHTLPIAVAMGLGQQPIPSRSEDALYARSLGLQQATHGESP